MANPTRVPRDALEAYDRLVATIREVERKGATMPYTSVNGNMFSFLTPEGALALRLPASEREILLSERGARPVEQHGRVMKEYVEVPGALLADATETSRLFAASYEYASGLTPKKTTR